MLTARGRRTIAIGLGAGLAGRIFGVPELFGLAAAAVVVTVVALAQVRLSHATVSVRTRALPPVVGAGEQAQIELTVELSGEGGPLSSSVVLSAEETYSFPDQPAKIVVANLGRGELARALFGLPTQRRGLIDAGSYTAALTDPLGLATRRLCSCPPARCVVLPRVEPLPAALSAGLASLGSEPSPSLSERLVSGSSTLRGYLQGDDLRRIHWPTTARVGELMVREKGDREEQGRVTMTVLLDVGGPTTSTDELDRAAEVAASFLVAATEDPGVGPYAACRLVATSGLDSGPVRGAGGLQSVLVSLAGLKQAPGPEGDRFWGALARLGGAAGRDEVLVVVGAFGSSVPDPAVLDAIAPGYRGVVVVPVGAPAGLVDPAEGDGGETIDPYRRLAGIGLWAGGSRASTLERRLLTVPLPLASTIAQAWETATGPVPATGDAQLLWRESGEVGP